MYLYLKIEVSGRFAVKHCLVVETAFVGASHSYRKMLIIISLHCGKEPEYVFVNYNQFCECVKYYRSYYRPNHNTHYKG
jgi:hypothetical protein